MKFKDWLFKEMAYIFIEDNPITLRINGSVRKVTGIDFRFEDFGQSILASKHFVQEFPHDVGEPGQIFVINGFSGYWLEKLNPDNLLKLHKSKKVFGDTEFKQILITKSPPLGSLAKFDVNPLNEFNKIDPKSILEPSGEEVSFNTPYDKKATLSWWDFAEVLSGEEIIKRAARIR